MNPPTDISPEKYSPSEYRATIDGRKKIAFGMLDLRDQVVLVSYKAYVLLHIPTNPPIARATSCHGIPNASTGIIISSV
jgi:hypothetical protein